jgi:hypothetical protein
LGDSRIIFIKIENNMKKTAILLLLFPVCLTVTAIGDGTRQHPYKTIEQALAEAQEGDTIRITSGKYVPAATSFEIKKALSLLAGTTKHLKP